MAKNKPYVPTAADRNEKAGGDQEMENRRMEAEVRSQTRGPGRGPISRNGMRSSSTITNAPFMGGSTYRKP